ncbi:MAG: type II and III secretion system protein, partial [Bryobacterales bacterium]|nr:type II and III secretion system protein [Bryobacterales bacterium]
AQSQAMLSAAARSGMLAAPAAGAGVSGEVDGDESEDLALEEELLSDVITDEDLKETREPLPPLQLAADGRRTNLHQRGPLRKLWEETLALYGLQAVFDESVRDGQPQALELGSASYRDAIRALELSTNTQAYPVTDTLLLVAPNDQNTQTRLEPTAAVAIPIPMTIQTEDAQEIANALRQALEIRALMVDGGRRLMLVRDRYSRVLLAQTLAQELMHAPQDIVLDVELREVNRRSLNRYGINWPTNFPAVLFTTWMNNRISAASGVSYLAFGANPMVGIGLGAAEAVAFMSRTDSLTVYRAELRSSSGREVSLDIGQQYPVVQQGFLTAPTSEPGSNSFFPQVQFRQLGFALKAKPFVWREQVTLDLELSVELLTGESVNGIPIFSNREAKTRVRLETGQTVAIAGLMNSDEAVNLSGLAGLGRVPGIGALFRQTTTQRENTELLVLLTPRAVQTSPRRGSSPTLYSGTATRFLAPL